jgi:hypothetical protein
MGSSALTAPGLQMKRKAPTTSGAADPGMLVGTNSLLGSKFEATIDSSG